MSLLLPRSPTPVVGQRRHVTPSSEPSEPPWAILPTDPSRWKSSTPTGKDSIVVSRPGSSASQRPPTALFREAVPASVPRQNLPPTPDLRPASRASSSTQSLPSQSASRSSYRSSQGTATTSNNPFRSPQKSVVSPPDTGAKWPQRVSAASLLPIPDSPALGRQSAPLRPHGEAADNLVRLPPPAPLPRRPTSAITTSSQQSVSRVDTLEEPVVRQKTPVRSPSAQSTGATPAPVHTPVEALGKVSRRLDRLRTLTKLQRQVHEQLSSAGSSGSLGATVPPSGTGNFAAINSREDDKWRVMLEVIDELKDVVEGEAAALEDVRETWTPRTP
eukprot:TRINITY_DN5011_c0_g1_i1.p1 TRINITY_DN5011_c0_g1~~TRINITY_DN5011_c0_g1_i1.p1  ORF type:complete len:331 (-),score=26.56 TRINITY_DN5011_c0_g1_i1:73-1065(-)